MTEILQGPIVRSILSYSTINDFPIIFRSCPQWTEAFIEQGRYILDRLFNDEMFQKYGKSILTTNTKTPAPCSLHVLVFFILHFVFFSYRQGVQIDGWP